MSHVARRTLLVEDDDGLRDAIREYWSMAWPECAFDDAGDLETARKKLRAEPTLLLLDVVLPDGLGPDLLPACQAMAQPPVVVAMSGEVSTEEAFGLASRGVRAFLAKPLDIGELTDVIESANNNPLAPVEAARHLVGFASIHDVQAKVRRAMLEQALTLTGWNRTAAARILKITRQAVQQMIKDLELAPPPKA